jgi:hypothetical protein
MVSAGGGSVGGGGVPVSSVGRAVSVPVSFVAVLDGAMVAEGSRVSVGVGDGLSAEAVVAVSEAVAVSAGDASVGLGGIDVSWALTCVTPLPTNPERDRRTATAKELTLMAIRPCAKRPLPTGASPASLESVDTEGPVQPRSDECGMGPSVECSDLAWAGFVDGCGSRD